MAGLVTSVGDIYHSGYTAAKHGVVALTRSFLPSFLEDNEPLPSSEGIKAYAICPSFANTQLVRDAIEIEELEKRIKNRVLTISEGYMTF